MSTDVATPVQLVLLRVDRALRELAAASAREQAVGLDLVRRRLRRELDRLALEQEQRAA